MAVSTHSTHRQLEPPGARTPAPGPLRRFRDALFAPIDIGMLVVFRAAFGGAMLIEVCRYFQTRISPAGPTDWIRSLYIEPPFHFRFYGFEWLHPLPGNGMYLVFAALGVAAVMFTIGLCYRLAATAFFLGWGYIFLLEQSVYLNHMYLIVVLSGLSIFLPAHHAWSVDAWLRPRLHSWSVPAWTLWLLRFQVGIVYFYGGIAKLNADWLSGVPMAIMLSRRTDFPLIGRFFHEPWMIYAFAYGGLLLDLFIVPLLLWRRTRVPAYVAVVLFHTINAKLFQIGIFPLVMVAVTMIFFPPEWLRPERLQGRLPEGRYARPPLNWRQKCIAGVLLLHVAVQVLLPFRHFLYPGDVSWTEEGHRFAWHMKLRIKRSEASFRVVGEDGEPLLTPLPQLELTPRQYSRMGGRPDMVLQYAHALRDELEAAGHENVRVYADVFSSLNGREYQRLIDPDVDLAAEPRNLWPADWIVPLREPRPTLEEVRAAEFDAEDVEE